MKDRIKDLRIALGLTQAKFGESLGIKQNTVAQYELGRNIPNNAVISLICDRYNVSEDWLRTGNGSMFITLSHDEQLTVFFADMLKVDERAARGDIAVKELITLLSKLSPVGREKLADIGEELVRAMKKEEGEQD